MAIPTFNAYTLGLACTVLLLSSFYFAATSNLAASDLVQQQPLQASDQLAAGETFCLDGTWADANNFHPADQNSYHSPDNPDFYIKLTFHGNIVDQRLSASGEPLISTEWFLVKSQGAAAMIRTAEQTIDGYPTFGGFAALVGNGPILVNFYGNPSRFLKGTVCN